MQPSGWPRTGPDAVIVVGGRLTSKRIAALTHVQPAAPVIRITPFLDRQDPAHTVDVQWVGDVTSALSALAAQVTPGDDGWLAAWQQAGERADRAPPCAVDRDAASHGTTNRVGTHATPAGFARVVCGKQFAHSAARHFCAGGYAVRERSRQSRRERY
jgi:2-succinyl-5-enolpyruvyl-6-hydroxy-3-cyclohexene-1-carboxylate synthase